MYSCTSLVFNHNIPQISTKTVDF